MNIRPQSRHDRLLVPLRSSIVQLGIGLRRSDAWLPPTYITLPNERSCVCGGKGKPAMRLA